MLLHISMLLGCAFATAPRFYIDKETQTIRDFDGRHTIFHGVNAVYKVAPYIPESDHQDGQESITDEDIQNLYDWGFNFVRLGVMWEAVERSPGVYNTTYLDQVDKLITRLGNKGIYTMIDAH
jgi:endoglycosylceramidase